MNRADARAGEQGDGGFGDHRHINRHAVAFLDAQRFQRVGKFADFRVQFRVGDFFYLFLRFALPEDGDFIARFGFQMAVEAIDGHVELAVLEPGVPDDPRVSVPGEFSRDGGLLEPIQRVRLFQPERVRLANRAFVQGVVLRGVKMRALQNFRRWREGAGFLKQRIGRNGLVWHRHPRLDFWHCRQN